MPSGDDARSQMLDFLLREMDFYLDSLNSLRTALSAVTGLGVTVVLALAGLAFRDGRQPPAAIIVIGALLLFGASVYALVTISSIRKAVEWPEGDLLLSEQPASVVDLRERYVFEFAAKVKSVRGKTHDFDVAYLVVLAGVASAAALSVIAVAQTPPPPPAEPPTPVQRHADPTSSTSTTVTTTTGSVVPSSVPAAPGTAGTTSRT